MDETQRSWRERFRDDERDRDRLRRIYGRNLILIILSLGAAIAVFVVSRLVGPTAQPERRSPEETRLERSLAQALPDAAFGVKISSSGNRTTLEVSVVVDNAPAEPGRYIARLEAILYHEARMKRGEVVIRLKEHLEGRDGPTQAAIAIHRTTFEEIAREIGQ